MPGTKFNTFAQALIGTLLGLVVAACLAVGTLTLVDVGKQQQVACEQVNALRSVLVTIVQRGEKSLPAIQYYKSHPAEMAAALAQAHAEEQTLQPVSC